MNAPMRLLGPRLPYPALIRLLLALCAALPLWAHGQAPDQESAPADPYESKLVSLRQLQANAGARLACVQLIVDSLQMDSIADQATLGKLKTEEAELASQLTTQRELVHQQFELMNQYERDLRTSAEAVAATGRTFNSRNNGWYKFWKPGTWRSSAIDYDNAIHKHALNEAYFHKSREDWQRAVSDLERLQARSAQKHDSVDVTTHGVVKTKAALGELRILFQKLRLSLDAFSTAVEHASGLDPTELSAPEQLARHAAEVEEAARRVTAGLESATAALPGDRVKASCPAVP